MFSGGSEEENHFKKNKKNQHKNKKHLGGVI